MTAQIKQFIGPPIDQFSLAEAFLALLDEDAEKFTFQTFDDNADRKDRSLARVLNGTLEAHFDTLVELNNQGAGVFITVNRTNLNGRKKADMTGVRALWQEADQGDEPLLPIEPHIVVESSPGRYHRYVLTDGPVDEFDAVQQRLVDDYGSDPAAKDLARVLRLPGFYHQKVSTRKGLTGRRHLVRVVETSSERPLSWETVLGHFPPVKTQQKKSAPVKSLENLEEVEAALSCLDPDVDYQTWIKIGQALHSTGAGAVARDLWDRFSRGALCNSRTQPSKYREGECQRLWGTFHGTGRTLASLFSEAYNAGWDGHIEAMPDALDAFCQRFVFVVADNLVMDLEAPPHTSARKLSEFRNEFSGQTIGSGKQKKTLCNEWLNAPARQTVRKLGWKPDAERVFTDECGIRHGNTFQPAVFAETDDDCLMPTFLEHIQFLIPQNERYELFMDWLAFTVHRPEVRIKFVPLLIAQHHGTGRGWVAEVLTALLGPHNVTVTKIPVMAGKTSDGQYQNYLYRSLACIVHEVHEGKERFSVNDRVRDLLTEPRLNLNLKYGKNGTYEIFTNFLLMSNHRDALVIPNEDRRIWVHETTARPLSETYYQELYQWLHGDGMRQLWWWLKRRDLSEFNPGMRSPVTMERQVMVQAGESPLEETIVMMLAELPEDVQVATANQVAELVKLLTQDVVLDEQFTQLGKILQNRCQRYFDKPGATAKQLKWDDKPVRPWVLSNATRWREASHSEVRDALSETQWHINHLHIGHRP